MLRHWWNAFLLVVLRAFLITLIALKSFFTRARMSHQNGIAARGRVRIVDNPLFPESDFFRPGLEFPCRLRHASVSLLDDAGLLVHGASLKFADQDVESPFDILMNGGIAAPFWNLSTFMQFTFTKIRGGRAKMIPYFRKNPRCFENVVKALRLRPTSFSRLYYYSQTPLEFRALDEKLRYIKFRLIPEDRGPESGIPDPEDLMTPWFQEARPGETLSPNYLKNEFRERVQTRGVSYHLQVQLHDWVAGDRREVILNSLYAWDEESHPWMDLAAVRLDAILPDEYGYNCAFRITNLPGCIRLIKPLSIYDPPSLEYLRAGGNFARRARFLGNRIFGPPPGIPDQRPNVSYPDEANCTVTADDVYMAASLPQNDARSRQRERQQMLEVARGLYQFQTGDGLPSYVKLLPKDEEFTPEKQRRMLWDIVGTVADLGLAAVDEAFEPHKGLRAYEDMYPLLDKPTVIERFRTDEEFGRQRLAGANPFLIRRCHEIPGHFRVDDAAVAGLIGNGGTLASAIDAGRVYLLDYRVLEGIPVKQGRYVCAPLCLLHVDPRGNLMPLAIQLGQSSDAGPTFTPRDEFWLWQTVKTHVQCADAQVQEAVSHLLRTHLVMETFAVSVHRQLSAGHPVHQLLLPHMRFTMAINHAARTSMLAPGGPIDKVMALAREGVLALMAKVWNSDWSFAQYDLQADLRARGVDDPQLLPNYHYRDDALPMWSAIEAFVTAILQLFYKGDLDVALDWELQAWARELVDPQLGNIRGFPGNGRLDTLDQLNRLLTTIIFTASAEHSSTNNGQYDMYGYIPNVPGAMYSAPPTTRQALTEASLVAALPGALTSGEQIAMVHLLSEPTIEPLGSYGPEFFAGTPQVEPLVLKFNRRLDEISRSIEARNSRIAVPYTYLDPRRVYPNVEI